MKSLVFITMQWLPATVGTKTQTLMYRMVFMNCTLPTAPALPLTSLLLVQCAQTCWLLSVYQIFAPFHIILFLEGSSCHPIPLIIPQLIAIHPSDHSPNIISLENSSWICSHTWYPITCSHTPV